MEELVFSVRNTEFNIQHTILIIRVFSFFILKPRFTSNSGNDNLDMPSIRWIWPLMRLLFVGCDESNGVIQVIRHYQVVSIQTLYNHKNIDFGCYQLCLN